MTMRMPNALATPYLARATRLLLQSEDRTLPPALEIDEYGGPGGVDGPKLDLGVAEKYLSELPPEKFVEYVQEPYPCPAGDLDWEPNPDEEMTQAVLNAIFEAVNQ